MKKKRCSVEPAARTSGHRPDTTSSHPKKSPSSKAHRVGRVTPCAPSSANQRVRVRQNSAHGVSRPTNLHRKFHAWYASLPTALERDTLLTPEWIAESVVQEVERFLNSHLPENFAARLAAKAYHLYSRHKHFHKGLNRPGNRGRENLLMFMRHWTAGWLKREHYEFYKKLPWSFGNGRQLPVWPATMI